MNETKVEAHREPELKSCPFEHHDDQIRLIGNLPPRTANDLDEDSNWCVTCPVCRCSTAFYIKRLSAIKAWNTRSRPTEAAPLCPVHKRIDDAGKLEVEIGGLGCLACTLHERTTLLKMLADFRPDLTGMTSEAALFKVLVPAPALEPSTADRDHLLDEAVEALRDTSCRFSRIRECKDSQSDIGHMCDRCAVLAKIDAAERK